MLKNLYNLNDKEKNNKLVNVVKSGLVDLESDFEEISEDEIKIEKRHKIVNIVKEILKFNKQNQSGEGLKLLIPNQMLTRLPIVLAQLKAGNNSKKLKNEIRQMLHSFYRSKKLTKLTLFKTWKQFL